jgi:hypothetical protein
MWIQFAVKFCWKANDAVNIVFKPDGGPFKDGRYSVTRACATEALAAGAAVRAAPQKRQK